MIKKLPIPIVGLMLALAATGNLVLSYGEMYRNIFGILSGIILVLVLIKIIKYPNSISESLENPVVASVLPTLSMGIILLSTYIKPFTSSLAFGMWILGLALHVIFMIIFTIKYLFNLNIKQVFPSWFIPYVGIAIGAITAPAFEQIAIGKGLFWFGIITYFLLLPIILKRVFKVKGIPEPAQPTFAILTAPVALCLAGYMNSFQDKNMFIVWLLVILSQISYLVVLLEMPKLLKLRFYPSYSAFTFPLVISAISIKLTNGFLINSGNPIAILKYIVRVEEILAICIVLYVLFRYIGFLISKPETVK